MSAHSFVAEFLKNNNYHETLRAFESEHGAPIATETGHDESLEQIIRDRTAFSADFAVQDLELSDANRAIAELELASWLLPFPGLRKQLPPVSGLVISAALAGDDLVVSSNDGSVSVYSSSRELRVRQARCLNGIVAKSVIGLAKNQFLAIGMNGVVHRCRIKSDKIELVSQLAAHKGLVVDAASASDGKNWYVATVGWDKVVKVIKVSDDDMVEVANYSLKLAGSCVSIVLFESRVVVVLGRVESTLLDVFVLDNGLLPAYKLSLNDAEFMANGFTPRSISIASGPSCPIVAVATSQEPYVRVIVCVLSKTALDARPNSVQRGQILTNTNSMAPQDKFSQPIVRWRYPEPTGVWLFTDDGVLRGIDVRNQTVAASVPGHRGRIKCVALGDRMVTFGADRTCYEWVAE